MLTHHGRGGRDVARDARNVLVYVERDGVTLAQYALRGVVGGALGEEHDFLWAYATTPGTVAYRGALFAAFRQVVEENGCGTSWIELLQLTNERLSKWSARREDRHALPSMEISSTCRGRAFAPADLYFAEEAEREAEDGEEDEEEMGAEEVARAAATVRISSGRRKGSWNRKL